MRYEYDNEGFFVGECEDAPRSTPTAPQGNENNFVGDRWVYVDRAALEAQKAQIVAKPDPLTVSPRQIRQALTRASLREAVEAAVIDGDQDLKDWWEFATQIEENHPMVLAMAQGLGVDETALHDLFVLAGSL